MSHPATGATARSWLFVPGDRPERYEKAAAAGADEVILDLEDAVAASAKQVARAQVATWLGGGGSGWVRINAVDTSWHHDDIAAVRNAPGLRGIVVPKTERVEHLRAVREALPAGRGILALVETAAGIACCAELARGSAADRFAFGSIDFALDIGSSSEQAMLLARSTLVYTSRAAGLPAPIDGVTMQLDADDLVAADANTARQLGFGGKLCIHPRQIATVRRAFLPSRSDIDWARDLVARVGEGEGSVRLDGNMVDRPVIERARRIVAVAAAEDLL